MFFCSFVNSFVRCCCCQRMSCRSVKSDTLTLFLEYVSYNIFVSMCFLSLNFVLLLFRLAKSRRISRHYSAILFSSKWCNRFSSNKFESIVCFFPESRGGNGHGLIIDHILCSPFVYYTMTSYDPIRLEKENTKNQQQQKFIKDIF